MVATEDILTGQELLVDYGTEYVILDASVEVSAEGARKEPDEVESESD